VHEGLLFGLAVIAGALVAALLAYLPRPEPTRGLRAAAVGLLAVVAIIAIGVGAAHAHTWWKQFTSPAAAELSNSQSRFVQAGSNHRWVWWQEAWHGFRGHPLDGTGAGSFRFTNLRYRATNVDAAAEPHDLPVQFLSETGAVGLALFLAATLTLVALARRRSDAELALALALPAYLLHGLLDIDWDFVAVSAPVFLVAGALAARAGPVRRFSPFVALAGSGVAVAVLASLFAVWLGERWSSDASASLGNPARAVTLAKRSRSIDPLSVQPLLTEALAEQELRHPAKARGLLLEATRVQPHDAETWYSLGEFDLQLGCPRHALPELERFYELNSQDPAVTEKDKALKLVNSGTPRC
jgi:tetratricopeptide (TPR) repeat protein